MVSLLVSTILRRFVASKKLASGLDFPLHQFTKRPLPRLGTDKQTAESDKTLYKMYISISSKIFLIELFSYPANYYPALPIFVLNCSQMQLRFELISFQVIVFKMKQL